VNSFSNPHYSRRTLLSSIKFGLIILLLPLPVQAMTESVSKPSWKPLSREQLATQLSREFNLPDAYVLSSLRKARFQSTIIDRMNHPYEARPYVQYRPLFVTRRMTEKGRRYIAKHRPEFAQAAKKFGVQPEIIAAILGMETRYGHNMGRDRVLDSLFTLATGRPTRAAFFQREMGHFLSLCQEEHLIPEQVKGSYAGAFGATQFIPSSFRHFAVDGDGDGKKDVWTSSVDIISSVANYFHEHGWDATRPVAHWLPALPHRSFFDNLRKKGIRTWKPLHELRQAGLPEPGKGWHDDDQVTLVDFKTAMGSRTALVHRNFYVITRWNRSYNYAMAITELADMLGCAMCKSH